MEKDLNDLTQEVVQEILKEVGCARCNWDPDFDDHNTINDWVGFVNYYASSAIGFTLTDKQQREQLVKAAGLLIAALVAQKRNGKFPPRHYD
jgi:transcriptional regulator of aromatic amino acid metabolism